MCFHISRVFLQIALSVMGAYRHGKGTVKHIRVGSDVFLFTDIPISCVRIIPVYI